MSIRSLMANTLSNVWHLRTVANASSKACYVCYKPTTRVLITPDGRDFFYTCPGHLSDRGFAAPIIDTEAEAARRKKEELDLEIEKIKQEYEEKRRRKREKKSNQNDKSKDSTKEKKEDKDEDDKAEKERDDKINALHIEESKPKRADMPRIYALHKNFYQMRVDRIRNAERAQRNQMRLQDQSLFPSVPKGEL